MTYSEFEDRLDYEENNQSGAISPSRGSTAVRGFQSSRVDWKANWLRSVLQFLCHKPASAQLDSQRVEASASSARLPEVAS